MVKKKQYFFGLFVTLLCCQFLAAQIIYEPTIIEEKTITRPDSTFTIDQVNITGNKKTKAFIILREMPFKHGDEFSLQVLVKKFEDARRQLMNTSLFHSVVVAVNKFKGNDVDVIVEVKERWYLFPLPYLKPVDRNLNQWLIEQHASLDRVNYGVKLLYYNATGRNDKLKVYLVGGYTKQVSFSYDRLYIDKDLKWGMRLGFEMGKNREINYNTINDKQVFLKDHDNYIRNFNHSYFELTYRRATKTRHSFGIGYGVEKVDDTIIALNPSYFKSGRKSIRYPEVYYNMTYYDLDYIPYPTKGYAADVFFGKRGFSKVNNVWELGVKGLGSWHLFPKTYFNLNLFGNIKLPFSQPYFNQRLLGYKDAFMQGYEYNVIDGVAGGYLKATIIRQLAEFKVRVPPVKKGKEATYIPFRILGKIYGNTGYVHNPQPGNNFLTNKMLYSGGIGIDIFTFYDVTFKLEWSFNQLGENGLFLHRKTIF